MGKVKLYLAELRAPFFTGSIVPVVLGTVIAWSHTNKVSWLLFVLTLLGTMALHAGANVANDYYDHKSGCDDVNREFVRPFTGGSRMIQKGLMSSREVLAESIVLYIIALVIGVYLIYVRGKIILLLGIIGALGGFFYTAPPFKFVHRGVGEIIIGLNFGVLATVGAYYVQTRVFREEVFVASIPIAILIMAILYINEFQDYSADKAVGKNHWVVRLGREKAVWGFGAMMVAVYMWVIFSVSTELMTKWSLLALLTLPLPVKAFMVTKKNFANSNALTPANAATIMTHLAVGVTLIVAYIVAGVRQTI